MSLKKFETDGKLGFKNASGKVIVKAQFDTIHLTKNGAVI